MKKYFDEFFDKVYVINLPHRTDRLANSLEMLNMLEISNYQIFNGISGRNGIDGCRKSHFAIYNDALKNNYKRILIFEDDFCFNTENHSIRSEAESHLSKCFSFLENNEWDLFYFDNLRAAIRNADGMTRFARFDSMGSVAKTNGKPFTHSYAINMLGTFPQCITNTPIPIDGWLMQLKNIKKYYYQPGIFDQLLNNKSDISTYIPLKS
jgi:GR25 family glycosyltransferase involved in LPS biosynthesis